MELCGRQVGLSEDLFFIVGPCVIESYDIAMRVAEEISKISNRNDVLCIYKSSFDKANRTSGESFRGPGLHEGLEVLSRIKANFGLPVTTDVHLPSQVRDVADATDLIQIPALLGRQTDLVEAAARSKRPVHFKKPPFMAPTDMQNVIAKARSAASTAGQSEHKFIIGERGTFFGYNDLIVDMRALATLRDTDCPVVFDGSHSTQTPGSLGHESGGRHEFSPLLVRAAVAAGVSGVFLETHPDPQNARCDKDIQWPLGDLSRLIEDAIKIDRCSKQTQLRSFGTI